MTKKKIDYGDYLNLSTIRKALAEKSLAEYIKQSWPIIEPGTDYLHNWHIDLISEYLEAITAGQITRLLINIPPRYMKSTCVSVMWPTWEWITRPSMRYLFVSYSSSLSTKHSVDRRTIIQSEWYRRNWGADALDKKDRKIYLAHDQNVKTEFMNTRRGVMVATSVGGSSTGKGGNRIVVDDPHNPLEAESDKERQNGIDFFNGTLSTRLDDKKKGAFVVVMQRLHEADLTGHILDGEEHWEHLKIPGICEERTVHHFPISGKEFIREESDLLWPEREGEKELAAAKVRLTSRGFAGQYQQRPAPMEGSIFKREWFKYWCMPGQTLPPVTVKTKDGYVLVEAEPLPVLMEQIQSWDMSFKDKKTSDFVVGQAWGRWKANCYLLDQLRDRLDFVNTVKAFKTFTQKHPKATAKLVEDAANGGPVINSLKDAIAGIIPVNPHASKEARAYAVTPYCESGNIYLPHPLLYPWTNDLIEELVTFPNAKNDDQCDAFTQAIARLIGKKSADPKHTALLRGASVYG